ncbi:MAG: hypothetical protein COB02_05440 [Candidatus Cloacimonadota bacterium]|nr:MAG: hypothetical protein COB02_05440 [Candidatus Cloacimonadota bacterium]
MLKKLNLICAIFSLLILCGCDKQGDKSSAVMKTNYYKLPIDEQNRLIAESKSQNLNSDEEGITPSIGEEATNGWTEEQSKEVHRIAETDTAEPNQCAKGVANILIEMGFATEAIRGHARDWDDRLANSPGWKKVSCQPGTCPPGAVLQYEDDSPQGTNGRGAQYGHVEIVTVVNGERSYCSDKCRSNSGGSVAHNFNRGGAWIYEGEI